MAAGSTGREKMNPWPRSHCSPRSPSSWVSSSMPSARVIRPSVRPSSTSVWMSAAECGPSSISATNERSILSTSTGNWRR